MRCKLVIIERLSGYESTIYSVYVEEKQMTLLDLFVSESLSSFKSETNDVLKRLHTIGHKTGARHSFFKHYEGNPGDGVCALYDEPEKSLRLYCIRYGSEIVILGGGGEKPPGMKALQESEKLTLENDIMRKLSAEIFRRLKEGEIQYSSDGFEFEGDLEFDI